jgi:N-methylhydantoinase A
MRYVGQNYELSVRVPDLASAATDLSAIVSAFHAAHEQTYGYSAADEPVQFVTLRLESIGDVSKPELPRIPEGGRVEDAQMGTRRTFLAELQDWHEVAHYDRNRLRAAMEISGPAIVEQMDTTTLILPEQHASVDDYGNLIVTESKQEGAE